MLTRTCPPHDWLMLTGGSIGYGMPCATGAAVASPDRRLSVCRQMVVGCTRCRPCGHRLGSGWM